MTQSTAADIWAEAVRETGIWMSPKVADLGRLIIPRMQQLADAEYERGRHDKFDEIDLDRRD
jgi:hypothetical protein